MDNRLNYVASYLEEVKKICDEIDKHEILKFQAILKNLTGRCFVLGLGGSAANASHLVNDLRKLCKIDTLCPMDNVSELTARINDDGWNTSISETLKISNLNENDCVLILSVGGGNETTSQNLVEAMKLAESCGAQIISIVSRDGGYAHKVSDACILIPVVDEDRITPHAEEFQAVLWHLIVNMTRK
jgi:D-sedoheptulose 7-phosphate isomerase